MINFSQVQFLMNKYSVFLISLVVFTSCQKRNDWLDTKANKNDVVPSTLSDYQAILDNTGYMNTNYPALGMVGSDNYYLDYNSWQAAYSATERNAYIWAPVVYNGEPVLDWNNPYKIVEFSNIALDGLNSIGESAENRSQRDNIGGSALFYRAIAFYNLAQIFTGPYIGSQAGTDLGIPVRLSSDVNEKSKRASLQQTYDQIILDLRKAEQLLPSHPAVPTRPSKIASLALLAKTFLVMQSYDSAGKYANATLQLNDSLLDFNQISVTNDFPFPPYPGNREIIFFSQSVLYGDIYSGFIDSNLLASYDPNDLRSIAFAYPTAAGSYFKGMYSGSVYPFAGLATNEIYLIRAECSARQGDVNAAMADLNHLLQYRFVTGSFVPLTAANAQEALSMVLHERRKELPFTSNTRWEDLRRLNQDPNFTTTLSRNLNGELYTLPPNDSRYIYPIPDDEIKLSGIRQNTR